MISKWEINFENMLLIRLMNMFPSCLIWFSSMNELFIRVVKSAHIFSKFRVQRSLSKLSNTSVIRQGVYVLCFIKKYYGPFFFSRVNWNLLFGYLFTHICAWILEWQINVFMDWPERADDPPLHHTSPRNSDSTRWIFFNWGYVKDEFFIHHCQVTLSTLKRE